MLSATGTAGSPAPYTQLMGERLRQEGYRGYFELDFLADMNSGEMYLGELNPRVTGASSMTNVTAVAYGDMPLFLFHLLEFMDVDYEIDVDELNDGWAQPRRDRRVEPVHPQGHRRQGRADRRGAQLGNLAARRCRPRRRFASAAARPTGTPSASEDEAFYLRIAQAGGYRYPGADIGILVTRGRLQTDEHELTDRARTWIDGIKRQFATAPLPADQRGADPRAGALLVQAPLDTSGPISPQEQCHGAGRGHLPGARALVPGEGWRALFERPGRATRSGF